MTNMTFANIDKASIMAFMQFKNIVDEYNLHEEHDAVKRKFFGNWIYPLIISGNLSYELLRKVKDYMNTEIIKPGKDFDAEDYHLHLAYICLVQNDYVQAISELDFIQNDGFLRIVKERKSFKSLLRQSFNNYPPGENYVFDEIIEDYRCINNRFYVYMLIRLQSVVKYWNYIEIEDRSLTYAKLECMNALKAFDFFDFLLPNNNYDHFNNKNEFVQVASELHSQVLQHLLNGKNKNNL